MCLAVGKLSEDEDVVITGSKDHYIKVCFFFLFMSFIVVIIVVLYFFVFFFVEGERTKYNYPQTGHMFVSCLNTCVPKPCSLLIKKIS